MVLGAMPDGSHSPTERPTILELRNWKPRLRQPGSSPTVPQGDDAAADGQTAALVLRNLQEAAYDNRYRNERTRHRHRGLQLVSAEGNTPDQP
jgi:hypothetical protein